MSVDSLPAIAPLARRRVSAPGLEALGRREVELEAEWERLQADGHGYEAVRAELLERKGAAGDVDPSLHAAVAAQAAFLAQLDEFLRSLHAHFMEQVVRELDRAMQTMFDFYGRRRLGRIGRRHRQLERLAGRYRELEHHYGSAQDHERIAVYQRFYAGVVAFSERVRELDPTAPRSAPPSWLELVTRARRGLVTFAGRSGSLLRLVIAGARILATAFAKKQPERGTPLTNRVDDLFRAWGDLCGRSVEVAGRELLPSGDTEGLRPGETDGQGPVTLYTPAHRHGVTDNVTFSHLGLPDYMVFNAVDQVMLLPQFLKDRAAKNNALIAVGGGRGPSVDRALEALARGVSHNVLIYPEGSVSEGFRGTRPPRRNFGEGLVRRIREAGLALRIVPVAYLDNARFLDLPPRSKTAEDRRLRVVVSPPLGPDAIDALLDAGGGQAVNRMVRLAWLESLETNERSLFGQDRVRSIERRLDRELDGIRYWGSLESAPVSDRLATASGDPIVVREEEFRGKRVRVLRLPESARGEDGKLVLPDLRDPDSGELLIGIRAPSHIYLNLGRQRFDGDIFRRLKVKERDYVYAGIVIRFMGLPVKSINAIRRKLEETAGREQRTLTCANSACRVIARAANIEIDDHADLRPFLPSHVLPTRTIRKLIELGVRNHVGDPVEVQIYKTDDRSLEEILAECRTAEIRIARDQLEMLSVGALRAVGAAARRLLSRFRS